MKRRVVVTGLGVLSALGEGSHALWEAALQKRSGIDFLNGQGKFIGAAIKGFDPEKFITQRKSIKVMARDIQIAVAAASLAVEDAQAKDLSLSRERFGVIVGSGVLNHELDELSYSVLNSLNETGQLDLKKFGGDGIASLFPLWLLKYLPNMPACHISILFDLEGPNNTITTGASAGLQAVGEAARIIERGSSDLMLAGGAESKVNPVGISEYGILGGVTRTEAENPKEIYRPFDERSRGFVAGEASGFVVLEELEHAKKRGVKIYAEIAGFGSSSRRGRAQAMKTALADAGMPPSELQYLQACGLGIVEEDLRESEAIHEVFNGSKGRLHVSASKAVTGFSGFSSGVLDLIIASLSLQHKTIPAVMNLEHTKNPNGVQFVKGDPLDLKIENAMVNAFGFNGQSASLVMRRLK